MTAEPRLTVDTIRYPQAALPPDLLPLTCQAAADLELDAAIGRTLRNALHATAKLRHTNPTHTLRYYHLTDDAHPATIFVVDFIRLCAGGRIP